MPASCNDGLLVTSLCNADGSPSILSSIIMVRKWRVTAVGAHFRLLGTFWCKMTWESLTAANTLLGHFCVRNGNRVDETLRVLSLHPLWVDGCHGEVLNLLWGYRELGSTRLRGLWSCTRNPYSYIGCIQCSLGVK
jgi:hypothetical protein